jgi:hypothetical protein
LGEAAPLAEERSRGRVAATAFHAASYSLAMRSGDLAAGLAAMAAALAAAGASLQALEAVAEGGEGGLIRCRLSGLAEAAIEEIAGRLAAMGEVSLSARLVPLPPEAPHPAGPPAASS